MASIPESLIRLETPFLETSSAPFSSNATTSTILQPDVIPAGAQLPDVVQVGHTQHDEVQPENLFFPDEPMRFPDEDEPMRFPDEPMPSRRKQKSALSKQEIKLAYMEIGARRSPRKHGFNNDEYVL